MKYNLWRELKNYHREIDKPLFFSVVVMLGFSIVNIYGIDGAESPFFLKQIIYSLGGIGIMVAVSLFDYRYLKNHSAPALILMGIALVLLLLTFTSQAIRGTNAWILIGGFSLEPSELAKLALIIILAKYFSQRHIHINQFRHVIVSGIYFGLPMGIVLNQPDLGSGIILTAIWFGMLLAAGINKRHLFILVVAGVLISYFAWLFLLAPYQKARIATFINPEADPRGSGYNLIQSKIAIGSGFWFGNGVGQGSQSRLGFLPEPHNDFAFASAVEQFGFFGAAGILGLMFFVTYKILDVGSRASNNFGRLFSIGMAIFIFTHVFVSASVNTGIMPITGIPFSLLSYGGSHMLAIMAGLGLLQSVKRYG